MKSPWKVNVLALAGMGFVLGVGSLAALVVGGLMSWPLEIMIPLAVTFGASWSWIGVHCRLKHYQIRHLIITKLLWTTRNRMAQIGHTD